MLWEGSGICGGIFSTECGQGAEGLTGSSLWNRTQPSSPAPAASPAFSAVGEDRIGPFAAVGAPPGVSARPQSAPSSRESCCPSLTTTGVRGPQLTVMLFLRANILITPLARITSNSVGEDATGVILKSREKILDCLTVLIETPPRSRATPPL